MSVRLSDRDRARVPVRSSWKLWTDATTPEKSERVARRVLDALGRPATPMVSITPYEKTGGHVVQLTIDVDATTWAEAVVETLALAQQAGYAWTVVGSVVNVLEITSRQATVSGVTLLECSLQRQGR